MALPAILLGNALWVAAGPWLPEAEYGLPGFPAPYIELSGSEREELADAGIRSIRPGGEGIAELREATLPGGEPAFRQREIVHMEDVRGVVGAFLAAWAAGMLVVGAGGLALARIGPPGAFGRALLAGSALSVAAMAAAGLVMLVSFEAFFESFHGLFFEGDSWRFSETYTLRSLYPDEFWTVAGALVAVLVAGQAALVVLAVRGLGGGARRRA